VTKQPPPGRPRRKERCGCGKPVGGGHLLCNECRTALTTVQASEPDSEIPEIALADPTQKIRGSEDQRGG
jgi:hypothetical protein